MKRLGRDRLDEAGRAHAAVRRGRALRAAGRDRDASREWHDVVERWGGRVSAEDAPELLRESVAEALFHIGADVVAEYENIDLSGWDVPSGRRAAQAWSRQQVEAKAEGLGRVEAAQAAVLEAGSGGWGLAALVRLGGSYEHMADALRAAWVPPWLTEEQAELYRYGLEDEAWRQEEKAVDAYRHAVKRSREIALYGTEVAAAHHRLSTLRPEEHESTEEDLLEPGFVTGGGGGQEFER